MMPDDIALRLDDWVQRQESDSQLFWRTPLGDLQNLLTEAVDRMHRAETALREIEDRR